jgi:hypothetical protein
MADRRVTCVKRLVVEIPDKHAGITHLGGENWLLSRGEVIKAINSGTDSFYTLEDGKRAEIRVRSGIPPYPDFVQTDADGRWTNNLLALPDCAASQSEDDRVMKRQETPLSIESNA